MGLVDDHSLALDHNPKDSLALLLTTFVMAPLPLLHVHLNNPKLNISYTGHKHHVVREQNTHQRTKYFFFYSSSSRLNAPKERPLITKL